jgi:hypothetical protein
MQRLEDIVPKLYAHVPFVHLFLDEMQWRVMTEFLVWYKVVAKSPLQIAFRDPR